MNIEVIFPIYNESESLNEQINKFNEFFDDEFRKNIFITIADNGSTDNTSNICKDLLFRKLIDNYLFIPEKGRGRAIKQSIRNSKADIVTYMDIDLSTDLSHFIFLRFENSLQNKPASHIIAIFFKFSLLNIIYVLTTRVLL